MRKHPCESNQDRQKGGNFTSKRGSSVWDKKWKIKGGIREKLWGKTSLKEGGRGVGKNLKQSPQGTERNKTGCGVSVLAEGRLGEKGEQERGTGKCV